MNPIKLALVVCAISLMAAIFAGCAAPLAPLTPQTKTQISAIQNQSAVAQAKAKAAAALEQIHGQDNPVTHPIAAANETVREIRPWLLALTLIGFTLWAIEFGLSFTAFSFLGFLAPVFRWVAILSAAALIALPFMPLGALIIAAALLGLFVYELVKDKGNVVEAFDGTEAELGFTAPAVTATQTTKSTVSTTISPAPAATSGLSGLVADVEAEIKKVV